MQPHSLNSPCFGLRHDRMEHQSSKNERMGDGDEPPEAAGPGGPGPGAPGKGKGGGRGGKGGRGGGDRSGDRSNPARTLARERERGRERKREPSAGTVADICPGPSGHPSAGAVTCLQ